MEVIPEAAVITIDPSTAAQLRALLQYIETIPPLPPLNFKTRQLIHNGGKP